MVKYDSIKAGQNYKGLLVKDSVYRVLEMGRDFFCLSVGGRPVYVPLWVTEIDWIQENAERERGYNE